VDKLPETTSAQFLSVTGNVPKNGMTEVAGAIKGLWDTSDSLLALFLDVTLPSEGSAAPGGGSVKSVIETVSGALKGKEIEPLWQEGVEAVR